MTIDQPARALPAPRHLPPPSADLLPCPHCGTRVGTRPAVRPVTRPNAMTFGGGWVTATLLVSIFSIFTLWWVVPLIFVLSKGSRSHEIIGTTHVDECVICHRPVTR